MEKIKANENLKKEIVNIMLDELINRKLIKKTKSTFDSAKELLKNYNKIKNSKKSLLKQIDRLKKSKNSLDVNKHIKSSLALDGGISLKELDTINNRILDLEQDIEKINCFISFIDDNLETIKSNPDYYLLERIYFNKENPKDIAIEKNCDDGTIYRKLNKLLGEIDILLFPGKYIDEIS